MNDGDWHGMQCDVDYDFGFEEGVLSASLMPRNAQRRGNLCVLANGRHLPPG